MPFPPADAALQALTHVAAIASAKCGVPIILVPQRDVAFGWSAVAVHPMQALETHYQAIVRDAERRGADPSQRRALESTALDDFYAFEAGSPRLLGIKPNRSYRGNRFPLPVDALRHAEDELRMASELYGEAPSNASLGARIAAARAAAWRVCELFRRPANPSTVNAPSIDRAAAFIKATDTAPVVLSNIRTALTLLDHAVTGGASVQMFQVIEPFYLSRLLVSYRVRSAAPVSEEDAMLASGALTEILNEQHWLSDWLAHAMIDLELAIGEVDPDHHTRFFLKGGRALAYLAGRPDTGRSDWDTQVLIDPGLPPADWYALYRDVSNAILMTLARIKTEFYSLLSANAAALAALPIPPPAPPDPFAEDVAEPAWDDIDEAPILPPSYEKGFTLACKAELIDVGMPRRDTTELREQWAGLHADIIRPTDGMPIPGYAYYVDEYVAMIREFFAGAPHARAKAPKRIERLATLLARDEAAVVIVAAMQRIPMAIWTAIAAPLSAFVQAQSRPSQQPLRYALIVLLDQFAVAHAMSAEPQLAERFAAYFAARMIDGAASARYPPGFRFRLTADADAMADAIGFGQWMSDRLAVHEAGRAALIATHRTEIEDLIRAVFGASLFDQRSGYELQFAIGGGFGARLHAEYRRAPLAGLESVSTVTIGLVFEGGPFSPETAIELIAPLVRDYLAARPAALFVLDETQPGVLKLFWAEPQAIEPFDAYCPLAIEIVARQVRERPLLSFIWGLPVLGLRDLIVEYQTRAAHIVEYTKRNQLRDTARALTDMLMTARA